MKKIPWIRKTATLETNVPSRLLFRFENVSHNNPTGNSENLAKPSSELFVGREVCRHPSCNIEEAVQRRGVKCSK